MNREEWKKRRAKIKEINPKLDDLNINRVARYYKKAEETYSGLGELKSFDFWRGDGECRLYFENRTIKF